MSVLRAILTDATPDELRDLAVSVAPYLPSPEAEVAEGWLDSTKAAAYAGCSRVVIQRAALTGELESAQDGPNAKRWFTRQWIDTWRASQ